ncbi:PKD domain-containing protein [Halosimplex carlsbadense 2-9-1]|uniref:PKD domain-containing protein n=1 Tax=Halosimplex carlsbadense 2-9-1 TaxID=797114 RepID=M0D3A4_9EURY|nr:PKD domain-containing protein [Halosimplex carlsbadense 2-9-1]
MAAGIAGCPAGTNGDSTDERATAVTPSVTLTPDETAAAMGTGTRPTSVETSTASTTDVSTPAVTATETATPTPTETPGTVPQPAKITATDGESKDVFGVAVALTEDRAVVGADGATNADGEPGGSMYVFERSDGGWRQAARVSPDDGAHVGEFGASIAVDGDLVLVGAPSTDANGDNSGAAYVFERSKGSWTSQAVLRPTDGDSGDYFGNAVALLDDTALVGAHWDEDPRAEQSGSAYVFERTGEEWSQRAKLSLPMAGPNDHFGNDVALGEETALIGAPIHDDSTGLARVFEVVDGSWIATAELEANDGSGQDKFGSAVALDGETALVGASSVDENGKASGAAYVFERSGVDWDRRATLLADDGTVGDRFGWSVALAGDTAVVGAFQDADPYGRSGGSAYVFRRADGEWAQRAKLVAPDGESYDHFGYDVGATETNALVGARWDRNVDGEQTGSAYLFDF